MAESMGEFYFHGEACSKNNSLRWRLQVIISVTTQVKATVQYLPVELLIRWSKVILTFESLHEITLKCDHEADYLNDG